MSDTYLILASKMTDEALAERLMTLMVDVRAFGKQQRMAFLVESATRLKKRKELNDDLALSVCYSPGAIRDSVDSYDDDDPIRVAVENASDEELREISDMIMGSDPTWRDFHRNIDMCVVEKFKINDRP